MRPGRPPPAPPWWPADEPWPPRQSPPWAGRRRFFAARFAGLFIVVVMLSVWGAASLVGAIVGHPVRMGPPIGLAIVAVVFLLTMRRVGRPLGDIVSAAERVARGDFDVRVSEHGPHSLRSVAAAFNSMAAKLAVQRRQRRALMADVAHELRTPLSVMQGRLEGMLDGVYPRDERHVASVLEETRMLARLVEDLRTLAHSESGTLALQKEPTDLGVLLEDARAAALPEAESRGVPIQSRLSTDLPLIDADPLRIREVVTNLLSNAIRHSPAGSRVVIDADADERAIVVRVADDGPGIPPGDVAHVFDRFYKGARSSGSGLGLTIARNLVTAHGGTIEVKSEVGKGTTILFMLPRGQD